MTPKQLINFLKRNKKSFQDLNYGHYEEPILEKIGEFVIVEELEYNEEEKWSFQEIVIHFKTQGFYIEEKKIYCWGDFSGVEFSTIEPVRTKIVYGNRKSI